MKALIQGLICISFMAVTGCGELASVRNTDAPIYVPNERARLVSFMGSEPKGFNGIKWGTKRSSLEGLRHLRTDLSYGGIEFYSKEGDLFDLGNGKRRAVEYGFWKEEFYVGMVTIHGQDDWEALKQNVFERFGVGAKPFSNKEEYLWVGKDSVMALRYSEISKTGTFYIRSESMTKTAEISVSSR